MVKYKVLKTFKDIHTDEIYDAQSEIDITVKRANEIVKNLGSSFIVRVDEKEDEPKVDKKKVGG